MGVTCRFISAQLFLVVVALLGSAAGQQTLNTDFRDLNFLLGDWVAEGGGGPGQGTGGFSFASDLQGTILIRKNYAEYAGTKDKATYRHDDLMVVYKDPNSKQLRATFFDNEGHVINYGVHSDTNGNAIEFLSDMATSSPRYRLTYQKTGADTLKLRFEIAPAATPDLFKTYIEASARRKAAGVRSEVPIAKP